MISIELLINHSLGNSLCHNAGRMMTQESRHHTISYFRAYKKNIPFVH